MRLLSIQVRFLTRRGGYYQAYMLEMIHERRSAEKKEERYDLFSSLLDANEQEPGEGEVKLSDRELIGKFPSRDCFTKSDEGASTQGNTFIFLLAGE